jgi:hypothetical protein
MSAGTRAVQEDTLYWRTVTSVVTGLTFLFVVKMWVYAFYASLFEHHENAEAEWFRISEDSEMWYRVYTLEMNSFTVTVRTKQSCVGCMLKFVLCATWVSVSCHLQPCMQSTQMASWLERTEHVLWFHNINFWLQFKEGFTWHLEGNWYNRVKFLSAGISLWRGISFVKGQKWLKVSWKQLEQHFFYSRYNIVQCASQQPNVPLLWLYTFLWKYLMLNPLVPNTQCDTRNAIYHTFMAACMRPPFKI